MRISGRILFMLSLILLVAVPATRAEQKDVPKFDPANQTTIKGVIEQVNNYECPISGTMGSHLTVRYGLSTVEVHLAASKFMKIMKLASGFKSITSRATMLGQTKTLGKFIPSSSISPNQFLFR